MTNPEVKRLYRSKTDRMIGGVCGGLGKYFNLDPVLMRLFWVILFFCGGVGFLAYIIAWIIMPEEPTA
ncbi:MAG: PspC domain-containing protein [Bacteroidales bacterium]|jgi:phage shock protein PspC (stress-responsive transcriptional regulator)|nr:PspC domain-containing protein [Bacteroidales bacterium]